MRVVIVGIIFPIVILFLIVPSVISYPAPLQVFNAEGVKITTMEVLESQGVKYVPLSAVSSLFNGTAKLEPLIKRVTVTILGKKIVLVLDRTYLRIDDEEYVISNPPASVSGKVAVPLEFLTELLPIVTGKQIILNREKWTLQLSNKTFTEGSDTEQQTDDTIEPELEAFRVILDPGHGGYDLGARGKSGVIEKDLTLVIAQRMKEILATEQGMSIYITRNSDSYVETDYRASFANRLRGDLFLSIHFNWSPSRNASGFRIYVNSDRIRLGSESELENIISKFKEEQAGTSEKQKYLPQSKQFAKEIADRLGNIGLTGIYGAEAFLVMMDQLSMPGAMVELLYLSNQNDIEFLSGEGSVDLLARTLCDSIMAFRATR